VTVRITEAELARDTHAVLEKVQAGVEIVVEQDHRPVAVIKTPQGPGRKISECSALAKAYKEKLGYAPVPDPDFAKDVQATIDANCEPLNPTAAEKRRSIA
jgi:antitoxin (DNA-binding transcriptional repressor) of toxin-antitoxin stability system